MTPSRLWQIAEQGDRKKLLRAACALAKYAPGDPRWGKIDTAVTETLVTQNVLHLAVWLPAFRPAGGKLLSPLQETFADRTPEKAMQRSLATAILADFAIGRPKVLAELLMEADEKQFAILYQAATSDPALGSGKSASETIVAAFSAEIDKQLPAPVNKEVFVYKGKVAADGDRVQVSGKFLAAKRLVVSLLAEKTYYIHLNSKEFDTFVVLHDKNGMQLAFDDDGGAGLNSLLRFQAPTDGSCTVYAAAYQGTGIFSLRIVEMDVDVQTRKERLAKRQANAAAALLKLNQPKKLGRCSDSCLIRGCGATSFTAWGRSA